MELADYARTLWRWRWLIVLGVAVAVGATYVAARDRPPLYQAKTRLVVGQALEEQQPLANDLYVARTLAETYTEIAQSEVIREAARQALGLARLPGYSARQVGTTLLLEIVVTDTDPQRAAAVANELAHQLILHAPAGPRSEQAKHQDFIQAQLLNLEASISTTQAEIDRQREALASLFSAREIADTQAQIAALQQKLNAHQANYSQLLLSLGKGATNALSVVDPATVPTVPISSGLMKTMAMAAAVGLALSVATAVLLEYLDDTIKAPEDVSRAMHLTTVGAVSTIIGKNPAEKLITARHPKSPIAEAYRVVRTNLQFSSLDRPLHTLLVTSPGPSEGKSTTLANLAVVMAQSGRSVIAVDADLRRPVLHRIFGADNSRGLTDALLNAELSLDGHLVPTGVENLRLLSTGPLPPNPSELLGSQRMAALIERLKEEAEVILFDTPPSLAVADASVLATQTDGVLLVADSGRTRRNLAAEAVARLQTVGANLVGVVLNRLSAGRRRDYYYYYYYYYGQGEKRSHRGGRAGRAARSGRGGNGKT